MLNVIDVTPYADCLAKTSDAVTDDVIPQTNHDIDILTSQSKDPVLQCTILVSIYEVQD